MTLNCSLEPHENCNKKSSVWQVVVTIFIIIISTIGNFLVVFAIYRYRSLRTISNLIILNLSIADLLFSLTRPLITAFMWTEDKIVMFSPLCSFSAVMAQLLSHVSMFSLVFISFERFLATNYPLKHRTIFTKKAVKIGLLVVWLFGIVLCGVFFTTGRYMYIKEFDHCMVDVRKKKQWLVVVCLGFPLPLVILLCCNVFIVKAVLKSKRFVSEHSAASPRKNVGFCKEHRTSLLATTIIGMFILLWSPYFIAASSLTFEIFSLPKKFVSTSLLLAVTNASVNPFIYGLMNKNFRTAFKKIVSKRN